MSETALHLGSVSDIEPSPATLPGAPGETGRMTPMHPLDLRGKRVLIFIVAYNAETTLGDVIRRIPASLRQRNVELLVIDDFSGDETFSKGLEFEQGAGEFRITTLRTPKNQGYGGNQKLGYRYAIENGFDIVALLHGDGQYAPEKLPDLIEPFLIEDADAVFGSRMIDKRGALRGGMPLYKWVGNQVLTWFQNLMLGTAFSEFHSGYRLYSTRALRQIPFERNGNSFHFDTEIIVQMVLRGLQIRELPIPTFYGGEICRVDGIRYAADVFRTMLRAQFHQRNLLYDRRFDVGPVEETYDLKLEFTSSHTLALEAVRPGSAVLDIGCGRGYVAREMAKIAARVTGVDQYAPEEPDSAAVQFHRCHLDQNEIPVDVSEYDQIFLLDIIEHLRDPDGFMETLRAATRRHRPEIVLTTANVAFFVTRFMLLFGQFNYGRKGILDRTHTRLFTFSSLRELFEQTGYEVIEMRGIPAPFPSAIGLNAASRLMLAVNRFLIRISRGLFSYQIFVRAQAHPTVHHLLLETVDASDELKRATNGRG